MNQCMKNLLFLHICLHLSDFPHLIPIKINVVYILHNVEEKEKIYVRFQFTNYYINICNMQYELESKKHNNLQLHHLNPFVLQCNLISKELTTTKIINYIIIRL